MPLEPKLTEMKAYARWLKLDIDQRKSQGLPVSQVAFGRLYGVSANTLSAWNKKIRDNGHAYEDFDIEEHLRSKLREIADDLLKPTIHDAIPAKKIEMALKMLGMLKEQREDKLTIEYTAKDIARDSGSLIVALRERLEEGGICPVCQRPKVLLAEICDN